MLPLTQKELTVFTIGMSTGAVLPILLCEFRMHRRVFSKYQASAIGALVVNVFLLRWTLKRDRRF